MKQRILLMEKWAIQGNLDPKMLLESDAVLVDAVKQLSTSFQDYPGYVFNLGMVLLPTSILKKLL